jgi:hypothetical protein
MSCFSESLNLYLDNVPDVEIETKLFDWRLVKDNARDAYVETAVDAKVLVVLNESLDNVACLELLGLLNVAVDEGVLVAVEGVSHYLFVYCNLFEMLLAMLVKGMD